MDRRLRLSEILNAMYDHVYYQPGPTIQLKYPCVVYKLDCLLPRHADNKVYHLTEQYTITAIDRNPDSNMPIELAQLPFCRMDRAFENDNLHHWVFTINV